MMSVRATTTRRMIRTAWRAVLAVLAVAGTAQAQTFSAAPVIFAATGSNTGLAQQVSITLTAPSTVRSISIPLPLAAQPEFVLVDNGGCVEDGTTVNASGSVCYLIVRFQPAAAGLRTAALVITDGAGRATAIPMSGVGFYPQISMVPAAMKTVAGLGPANPGLTGDGGAAALASFRSPRGVAADSYGNVYVADTGNNIVRMLDAFGNITTVAGGGTFAGTAADGGAATTALLSAPTWLAVDAAGNLYIAESGSHVVRRVAMSTSRTIATVAGNYIAGFSGDGAAATTAQLNTPEGVAVDTSGNLYIADSGNYRVRRVDAVSGAISTFAGTGAAGFNASSTPVAGAQFATMSALALDLSGNLLIADTGNHAVRKISGGNVVSVAGTGAAGVSGDGAAAVSAQLSAPAGLALSPAGDIYISDANAGTVRKVQSSDGMIETVAGSAGAAGAFSSGVSPSTSVQMNTPQGLAFDTTSNLLVIDSANSVVRELVPLPAELNFAAQASGTSSAPQAFRIENIGNTTLTLVSTAAVDSTTSANFTLASGTDACSGTVASGAHCSFAVRFAPQTAGGVRGEVDVTYQSANPNFNSVGPVYLTGGAITNLAITPTALAPVLVNTAVSLPIVATGGTGSVTLDLEGVLPSGMTFAVSGTTLTLSGTPTQVGSYNLTAFASDALGATATQAFTLQVMPAMVSLAVTEAIHVTDAPSELLSTSLIVIESIHVSDTPREIPAAILAVVESIHVSDAPSNVLSKSLIVMESIHVTDAPSELPSAMLAVVESIHVMDTPINVPSVTLAVIEAIHVADADMNVPSTASATNETIRMTDAVSLSLGLMAQSISAPTISARTYGDAAFAVTATSSSGLPVAVAVQSGAASVAGNTVSLRGAGNVTLIFTQAGNSTYNAATPVSVSFNVAPAQATLKADSVSRAYATANPTFTFQVSGLVNSDTIASFTGAPTLATTATLNSAAGAYPISVSQGTLFSPNYALSFLPGTLTVVGGASQTINFVQMPAVPLAVGTMTLTARTSSGLKVTYTVSGAATVSGSRLTLTGTGSVSVTASQAGNSTYAAAPSVTRTFQVTP